MSSFGKRVDGFSGHRREPRQQVSLLGSAIAVQGSKSVLVEDLCANGAKLLGHVLPAVGKDLVIRAGQLDVFGRVVWSNGGHCGVIFDAPLAR